MTYEACTMKPSGEPVAFLGPVDADTDSDALEVARLLYSVDVTAGEPVEHQQQVGRCLTN